jgi:hypothetical protein
MPDPKPRPDRITAPKEKICKACRRPFSWSEKRARDWDIAKYCGPQCSGTIGSEKITELEDAILQLLAERGPDKSICPSEAAKLVGGRAARHDWESLMEPAREAARRLVKAGRVVITQRGKIIDPARAKGPIRLRLL